MVQLRYPRTDLVGVRQGTPEQSHNQLVNGRLCDGCRYETWCGCYGCCWRLEKADIAADRAKPRRRKWTEQTVIDALQAWHARHGTTPRADDWNRFADGRPSHWQVLQVFGRWNDAVRAAGLKTTRNRKAGW